MSAQVPQVPDFTRNIFDNLSPLDYRYYDEQFAEYFSARADIKYQLMVEAVLAQTLYYHGLCSESVAQEVRTACEQVTVEEVAQEEARIHHNVRALVNCIQGRVSDEAKPIVHMTATSFDIIDTAKAAQFRDGTYQLLIPVLSELETVLIEIAEREADTPQIGRTHGQHAVPITFGFAIAQYVSRLGGCIKRIDDLAGELVGKFAGATGSYNALSLLVPDPENFELILMNRLGLVPAEISTQIVPPEPMTRLLGEIVIAAGVIANLATNMRSLQQTEIAEVGEAFEADQVGSSTMPHKLNPESFENVCGMWKIILARIITVFLDLISEHQRDLTNSAPSRTYGEIIGYLISAIKRTTRVMKKLVVNRANMQRNLKMQGDLPLAEPWYILLARRGHPNAHEKVRQLTLEVRRTGRPLWNLAYQDSELVPYLDQMTDEEKATLQHIEQYTGIAAMKARQVAEDWRGELEIMKVVPNKKEE